MLITLRDRVKSYLVHTLRVVVVFIGLKASVLNECPVSL